MQYSYCVRSSSGWETRHTKQIAESKQLENNNNSNSTERMLKFCRRRDDAYFVCECYIHSAKCVWVRAYEIEYEFCVVFVTRVRLALKSMISATSPIDWVQWNRLRVCLCVSVCVCETERERVETKLYKYLYLCVLFLLVAALLFLLFSFYFLHFTFSDAAQKQRKTEQFVVFRMNLVHDASVVVVVARLRFHLKGMCESSI